MSHRIQHRTGKSFLILVILSITLFIAVLGMELLAGFMNRQIFVTDIRQSGYGKKIICGISFAGRDSRRTL